MTDQTPEPAEVAPAQPLETAGGAPLSPATPQVPAAVTPTQVRKPWRATARTAFAAVLALAAMLPLLVDAAGLDQTLAPVAGVLAIAAAITRIMAIPGVESFLQQYLPFLSAAGRDQELDERGAVDVDLMFVLGGIAAFVAVFFLVGIKAAVIVLGVVAVVAILIMLARRG